MHVHVDQSREEITAVAVDSQSPRWYIHIGLRANRSDPAILHQDSLRLKHAILIHRHHVHVQNRDGGRVRVAVNQRIVDYGCRAARQHRKEPESEAACHSSIPMMLNYRLRDTVSPAAFTAASASICAVENLQC